MSCLKLVEGRVLLQTMVHLVRAAGIEAAAAVGPNAHFFIVGHRNIGAPLLGGVGHRDGVDQGLHVGVLGIVDYLDGVALFGHSALIEQINLVANLVAVLRSWVM